MGSKTSTTKQENAPPAWAAPLFKTSAQDAGSLYASGAGGNTYQGSTVAPLSGTTMQGVNQLAQAGQGWNTAGTRPLYQGIGQAAVSNPFMSAMGDLAGWTSGQQTSADKNLQGYASGEYLKGEGNPFYRQRLEREIGDSTALLNSTFSGSGRYGSGANQGVIAENAGNMLMKGLEEDFNRQTTNQFNAVNQIDQSNQGLMGLLGNFLSNAGGMYGTGIGQAQTAANSMAGLDQQNFTNRLTGAGATLDAGKILDTQGQRQLADQVAKWYANDNQDWTRLGMLQSAAAGAAGPYGSQVATSRQPMDIGSILGGVGSLFGSGGIKSDARLKENIIPLGWHGGFPIYEFSYIDRPGRFIGVIAQDVLMRMPDAVIMEDDGFYAVDYRMIGFPMTEVVDRQ